MKLMLIAALFPAPASTGVGGADAGSKPLFNREDFNAWITLPTHEN